MALIIRIYVGDSAGYYQGQQDDFDPRPFCALIQIQPAWRGGKICMVLLHVKTVSNGHKLSKSCHQYSTRNRSGYNEYETIWVTRLANPTYTRGSKHHTPFARKRPERFPTGSTPCKCCKRSVPGLR